MDENMQKLISHPVVIPAAVGVVSLGVGIGVGYFIGKRRCEAAPVEILHEEPAPLDLDLQKEEIKPPPVIIDQEDYEQLEPVIDEELRDVVAQADEIASQYRGDEEGDGSEMEVDIDDEPEEILVTRSVFPEVDADWDWEIENELRAGLENGEPYVLHIEEYRSNTSGMDQADLTWYEADGVLADNAGIPVEPREINIGDLKWGHGSGDPNVFYVRVPRNRMEFEVLRSTGSFHHEVLGQDAEDAAEVESPRRRRQRLED